MFSSFSTFAAAGRNNKYGLIISNAPKDFIVSNITSTGYTISFTQPPNGYQLNKNPVTSLTTSNTGSTAVVSFTASSLNPTYYVGVLEDGNLIASSTSTSLSFSNLTGTTTYYAYIYGFLQTNNTVTSIASTSFRTSPVSTVTRTGMIFELVFGTNSLPTLDTFGSTLTNTGPPSMVNDNTRGYVLYCNVNQYVTTTIITGSSSFSRAWWYKPNVIGNYANALSSPNLPIFFYNPAFLTALFNFSTGPGIGVSDSMTRGTGTWTHYVVCYDKTAQSAKMYVNGILTESVTTSFTETGAIQINAFNSSTSIGNAYFDNIYLYNRALSQSEVTLMYNFESTYPTL